MNNNTQTQRKKPWLPDSVFNKIVAVITALSLVFLQVPVSGIIASRSANAANEASEQTGGKSSIDVPLSFEHAYIVYDGQTIAEPATKVTLPTGAAMKFEAKGDRGYQVESVKATISNVETELKPADDGTYKLTADEVATTDNLAVKAITAPTVDDDAAQVTVGEEETAPTAKEEAAAGDKSGDEGSSESDGNADEEAEGKADKAAGKDAGDADEVASDSSETEPDASVSASSSTSESEASESASSSASDEKGASDEGASDENASKESADKASAESAKGDAETTSSSQDASEEKKAESTDADRSDLPDDPESDSVSSNASESSSSSSETSSSSAREDDTGQDESTEKAQADNVRSTRPAKASAKSSRVTATSAAASATATVASDATSVTAAASSATPIDSNNATVEFGIYKSSTDRANRTNELTDGDEIALGDTLYGLMHYDFKAGEGPTTGRLTYTYTLPDNINAQDKAATTLYDDSFNVAGTWEIKDGVVYFHYDESWAKKHPDGGGYFSFDFQLVEETTETGKDATFSFPGATTTVTVKVSEGDLTGSKSNSGIDPDGYVTYTVKLHAQQDFPYFQFTDKLDSGIGYVDGSFAIDGKPMNVTTSKNSDGSSTATASASSIAKGDHVITYRARIDQDAFDKLSNWGTVSANNVATWKFGDSADHPQSHYATSYVWAQKNLINKTNSGVSSDGTVSWTVAVNGSSSYKVDLAGYTFTDTIGSGQKYTGAYEVLDSNWSTVATGKIDKGATSFTYVFPNDAGAKTYYIKYTTVLDDTSQQNTVGNTAKITPPGGTPTTSENKATYYPPSSGGSGSGGSTTAPSNINVIKEVLDSSRATTTGVVSWHSAITVNNWPSENAGTLEFYDDTWNYGNNKDWNNWVAYATLWQTGTPTLSAGGVELVEGTDYEIADASGNVIGMTATNTNYIGETVDEGLRIQFKADSDTMKSVIANHTPIDIYYTTMCDGTHATYTNTAYAYRMVGTWAVDKVNAQDSYTIEGKPSVTKKNVSMYLDRDRGKWVAEWQVHINGGNNTVFGDLKSPTVRVIDTLPEGMTYIAGSASSTFIRSQLASGDPSYWATNDKDCPAYAPAVSQDGSTLTFEYDFTRAYDRWGNSDSMATQRSDGTWTNSTYIVLTFRTELNPDSVVRDGSAHMLYNSAKVDAGGVDLGTGHAQATYTDSVIEKVGHQDGENPVVHYTITVNKGGEKLDPEDSHTAITLNDKLDTQSTVLLSSIKVTNLDTGADITGSCPVSYDASAVDEDGNPTTAFSVTIPDATPVTVEYNVLLSGSIGEQVEVTNTASLEGLTSKETKTSSKYEVRQSDAGVYGSATKITLTKSDADDVVNKQLAGAEFTLYRVDMGKLPSGTPSDAQLAAASSGIYVGTTDENGVVYLGEQDGNELALSVDTLYCFKETKAPAGYELDGTLRYVMVKGGDYDSQLAIAKSHGITPSQTVVYNAVDKEEEEPATIEVSGTKIWDDQNDRDRARPKSITVNLLANGVEVAEQVVMPDADGNWTYTFSNLPKADNSGEITYTVTEDKVAGYTATVKGYDITNKHEPEKVDVSGAKVWDDGDDQDGIRPDEVTVHLLANGKDTGKTTKATAKGSWTFSFTGLDKNDANGNAIVYTVTEDDVNGFAGTVAGSMSEGFTITNKHTPETVEIPVKKVWDDADNRDGVRLTQVYAQLYANGVKVEGKKVQLKEANGWSNKFTDLPKYEDGKEIVYTVKESTTVPGYEKSVAGNVSSGFTITNTHTPETTTVSGTKSWSDNDNVYKDRPTSVTVHLLADGVEVATTTATEADGWKYEFIGLPVYKEGAVGQKIVYTVAESDFTDYTASVVGSNLLNTFNPETTSVTVTKAWDDGEDEDGVRPNSVWVTLYLNGSQYRTSVQLTAASGWTYTWTDLPKRFDGKDAVYTVGEYLPEGYDSYTVSGDAAKGFTVTNKRTVTPSTAITIFKVSAANTSKTLGNAKFTLTPVDPAGEARTYTTDSSWGAVTFDKLKKGASYTLEETVAPGGYQRDDTVYHLSVSNDDDMTVTFAEDGVLFGRYTTGDYYMVVSDQPDSGYGSIILTKDVVGVGSLNTTVRANVKFRVENVEMGDYVEFTGIGNANKAFRTDLLNKNGQSVGTLTIRPQGSWGSKIENLPSGTWKVTEIADGLTDFSGVNGAKSGAGETYVRTTTYSVDGDVTQLIGTSSSDPQTLNIKNTYYNNGSLTLTKEFGWDYTGLPGTYAGNQLGESATKTILAGITFTLTGQNTGEVYTIKGNDFTSKEVTSKSGNSTITVGYYNRVWTITNLPYDTYTVVEASDGYCDEASEPDTILHKFYTTGTFDVGKDSATTNVSIGDTTGVRGTGTVSEESATVDVNGADATMNVLDVYYRPKAIEVTKSWDVPAGLDYTPEDIEVQLVRSINGVDNTGAWQQGYFYPVTPDDVPEHPGYVTKKTLRWNGETKSYDTVSFTNLPAVTANGEQITYEVREVAADGSLVQMVNGSYTDSDGNVLTSGNTYIDADGDTATATWGAGWNPKKNPYTEQDGTKQYYSSAKGLAIVNAMEATEVSGKKSWDDNDNQDGKRPSSITVRLLANGEEVATAKVTADDNWEYAFKNLPKYKSGKEVEYTVAEDAVPGYKAHISGSNITNAHTPEKTSVKGTKTWDDADNQDGKRPKSITVRLWNGATEVASKTVKADGDGAWSYEFAGLDKYADGKEIKYTVTEDEIAGYTTSIDGTAITNTHTPETTEVSGVKTWIDDGNQDGVRPDSVTIRLLANGKEIGHTTVSADNGWTYSFGGLPKYQNGAEIAYSIAEDEVEGYAAVVTGTDVSNAHTSKKISVSGEKTWNDNNDQDGKRPASVTVHLLANGEEIRSTLVSAASNWKYEFTDLDAFADGKPIAYTVTEDEVVGYTTVISGTDITNTHTPETTSVAGAKVWDDNNDQDGKRPSSITVRLLANGVEIDTRTIVPDADGNWPPFSFTDLPVYESGERIDYTLVEDEVEGYTTTEADLLSGAGVIITNEHTPETTSVSGVKTWADASNQDGKRPTSITVRLWDGETEVASKIVSAADDWAYTFDNLPKYENGTEVSYTVTEDEVAGYTTSVDGADITNMHAPEKTQLKVVKVWDDQGDYDGLRPNAVTVQLYADGVASGVPVTLDEGADWEYTWTDLDKFANGSEITYTVAETGNGNTQAYTTSDPVWDGDQGAFVITNRHEVEKVTVNGTKTWSDANDQDGRRPASITVNLLANGIKVAEKTVLPDRDGTWSFEFANLDKYEKGIEITYTISEEEVTGYTATIAGDAASGFTIDNAYSPEKTSVTVSKVWDDADNQDGVRPIIIPVRLMNGSEVVGTATLVATNDWTYTWTNLDRYAGGKEIAYTVEEDDADGYTAKLTGNATSGFTLTNTHAPSVVDVKVDKAWNDANDQDGKRPEGVEVELRAEAGGTAVALDGVTAKVTLSEANNWHYEWANLPQKHDGVDIVYSLAELDVSGDYTSAVKRSYSDATRTANAAYTFAVTNEHAPELTNVSGVKTWVDNDDQDGARPDSITVRLWNGSTEVAHKTVMADDGWAYTFTDLPKYADGTEISYTVTEDAVEGYTTEVNGLNIVNTHAPEKTSLSGEKMWSDANDQDGTRPTSVTVRVWNGTTEVASTTVKPDKDGTWSYEFTGLDKFANGKEISYTVTEDAVADYTTSIDGTAITNTHTPEKTSVSGTKTWNDADDQDGKRPDEITVRLLADGEEVASKVVTADDDWAFTFDDLPKFAAGKEIVYTIAEDAVADYTTTIDGTAITNTHTPETTSLSGEKTWNDANNQDNLRPLSIVVKAMNGNQVVAAKTVAPDADGNWKYEFDDLPKYANGAEIAYTIAEEPVDGYTATVTGTNIENAHAPEKTSVSGVKTWIDSDDQDGKRPESVTVRLWNGEKEVASKIVTADDGWVFEFKDLDKYANGTEINYTVTEDEVAGYSTDVSGFVITNSYTPETTRVSGVKIWSDDDNRDNVRPESITVRLFANGEEIDSQAVTAGEDGTWAYSFDNLPVYESGKKIAYTVTEDAVTGYETAYSGNNIVNTHTPETTSVSGKKTWSDADDQDGKRPTSITVRLWNGATEVASKTVTAADNWAYAFENLPKYEKGNVIAYIVTEDAVTGYSTEVNGFDVTNTHAPETTSVSGTKTWSDADNQDGKRPTEITVRLWNGTTEVASKTVTEANGWSYSFDNLPKYQNGTEVAYTVTEDAVANYTTIYNGTNITNVHTPETKEVFGTKTWNDASNQDGKRPSSITVNLLADGVQIDSRVLVPDANGAWPTYSFTDLPVYKNGVEIAYTVTENAVSEYGTEVDGASVVNTHTPETTSVTGTKTWADNNNQDGKRPASVTINLLANGSKIASKTVTADDNWAYSFDNLPVYANGVKIAYTVTEDAVADYETSIDGYYVTNTHQPEKTELTVVKAWNDENDYDGLRPDAVKVQLYASGQAKGQPVTLNETLGWTYTWTGLDKYVGGLEVTYTVAEVDNGGSAAYTTSDPVYDAAGKTATITNTHVPEKVSVGGKKTWSDANNQDGKRPSSITVDLLADGSKVASKTVTAGEDGDWSFEFTNLDKYAGGKVIAYAVTEEAVEGYTATVTGDAVTGFTIDNAYTPEETKVTVTKKWDDAEDQDGIRPGSVKVRLLADGKQVDAEGVTSEVELNAGNNWTYTWTGLDRYANGTEIVYSVEEDAVADYSAEIAGSATAGYTLKNTHAPALVDVKADKDWNDASNQDGKRADSIDVQLNATVDGVPIAIDGVEMTATLNEANSWHYEWKNLPQKRDGKVIVYTLAEVGSIDGYETAVTVDEAVATATANPAVLFAITNDHTPERIDIPVTKSWNDASDQDGKRPASITVQLFAGDEPVLDDGVPVTAVLNADNNWSAAFKNLPKFANGSEIAYRVVETVVPADYEKDADGTKANDYTLANSHETEKVNVSAKKAWDDANNQDGKRGTFVTVELRADGEVVQTGTLNADNGWTIQWNDLPKYANGSEIDYTLTEVAASVPEGYTASVTKSVDGSSIAFTATNAHTPEKVNVRGSKAWSDASDQDGKRPASITVNLFANGVKIASKTVAAADDWAYAFDGLDKYANGTEITYTVSEDEVAGYTTAIDGFDITNSYKPGETSVKVVKAWNDADDQDGVRPMSVKAQLFADGAAKGDPVELSADNGWTYAWESLPQKAAGKDIAYTVAEVEGDWSMNYTTAKAGNATDGFVITNTHKPEDTSAKVTKVWNDANNQDGKRAGSIEVQLLADGVAYGAPVTLNEQNNWTFNWSELPKKAAGKDIAYTLAEVSSTTGYATAVEQNGFEFTVTNSHDVELIDIPVTKTWNDANNQDGIRPTSVTVKLMNGDAEVAALELNAGNNWSGTFTGLPKYDNGHEITYTLQEVSVEGYTSEITGSRTEGFEVANTHTPEVTTAKVTKVWDDADNQDGKRSDEVTVQLLSNDGAYGDPVTLSVDNGWTYEWTNLPKFANTGQEISYTVTESGAPADYTATITGDRATGYTITNSYTPGVRNVTVSKAWDDAANQDGKRPGSVKVRLLANGKQVDVEGVTAEVELNADNNWTYTWENLDQMKSGKEIAYTVEEVDVPEGYKATTAGTADEGYVITNKYTPETTSVEASKAWSDDDNRDGLRPEGVTLILYANGEQVGTENVTADARGNWAYTFENLPKYANGTEIVYTIGEVGVEGYDGAIDGFAITNAHDSEKVSVSGAKTWIDADNVKGLRPDKIIVNLLADGKKFDSQEVTAESGWTYSFDNLNKYRDGGTLIVYTVTEEAVENYTTAVDGYDITNKLIPEEQVAFFAMKTLNGRTLSADEFSFQLLENGEVLQTVTNAGDGHARFDAITYTLDDLGVHSYAIREVAGDVAGVTYDATEHHFSTTVTDNGDGTLSVAYDGYEPEAGVSFENSYAPSGSVGLEVNKLLDGQKPAAGAYTFQLADAQGNVYASASNDADGAVKFPALNFKAAGTYAYVITEVLPDDVQYLSGTPVAGGVAYDSRAVNVTIKAIDNFDGTMRFTTTYDGDDGNGGNGDEAEIPTFNNVSVPEVTYPLTATKVIEGRDFKAGDSFTFTVTADDGSAPMPAREKVTINPTGGSQMPVNFGDITFTTDDLGKTYTYSIGEDKAGETSKGLTNDPFAHWVKLTVVDAGDGTMAVNAEYQGDADSATLTNTYGATGEAVLTATKVLEGRDLAANEFFFELTGDSLPAALHANAAADGSIAFPVITYTQADAGKDFTYTISEVQGALGGVTYDESSYDVTVHVEDNGDGTLAVTYDYGDAESVPVFHNAYEAEGTSVQLTAHKALLGGTLEGGEFSFTLTGTSSNASGTKQTVENGADGTVAFDAIDYGKAGVYRYSVVEEIPSGATDNGDGTFTSADGVVYDATEHTVTVTVTDDGEGSLVASVDYDNGASGISFGNTKLVRTGFEFDKYYFGGVGTFDFKLTATDSQGIARSGTAVDYSDAETVVDDGSQAFTVTVQNGAFSDGAAKVVFPEISYTADGDYYYLIEEDEENTTAMVADDARYLAHVAVAGGKVTSTTFDLIYDGENQGATTDLSFYNNSTILLGFQSLSGQGTTDADQRTSVYPKAKKYLNGSTDELVGGEFSFELIDDSTGKVLATATNDESGNVAFFDESTDPGLVYDAPGTYRYTIREVAGDDASITYDDSAISLTVTVQQTDDGLVAATKYNGPGGSEPAFYNVRQGIDVTVQKVSRETGEGLSGCTYALWMVGDSGDVLVQEAVSDESGYITFTDVSLIAGRKYYFKEVAAPAGHTLDPNRSEYFMLNAAGDKLVRA